MQESALGVSEDESLLDDVCSDCKKGGRREPVLEVCEDEEEKTDGADSLVKKVS